MSENKLEIGEKYLVLQAGEIKIPFFATKTKDGKKYFHADLKIWINEKKKEYVEKEEDYI